MLDIRCDSPMPGVHWVWSKYSPSTLSIAVCRPKCAMPQLSRLRRPFRANYGGLRSRACDRARQGMDAGNGGGGLQGSLHDSPPRPRENRGGNAWLHDNLAE